MRKPKPVSSLLRFKVGPFRFCVDTVEAQAIVEAPEISTVPMAPKSIAGVFSYRGRVMVVVNLRRKFGVPDPSVKLSGQIILTRIDAELKGFLVDDVLDILENDHLKWQALPGLGTGSIISHTVLKEGAIFFHTDFKKLFEAPESEELGSILMSMAGGRQNEGRTQNPQGPAGAGNGKSKASPITDEPDLQSSQHKVQSEATPEHRRREVVNPSPALAGSFKNSAVNAGAAEGKKAWTNNANPCFFISQSGSALNDTIYRPEILISLRTASSPLLW